MIIFGGYRTVWIIAMFDLPTDTATARRNYTYFRKSLISHGFIMLQYSVYARHYPSEEKAEVHETQIKHSLPPEGEVRLLNLTDKQFGKMKVFYGKNRQKWKKPLSRYYFCSCYRGKIHSTFNNLRQVYYI